MENSMGQKSGVLLKAERIDKRFPGVHALKDVSLELLKGEVHALLGENGAGKSTLINVLGGVFPPNSGEIFIEGKKAVIRNISDAQREGIAVIHQELVLVPYMTIAENIYMGREPGNKLVVDRAGINREAETVMKRVGLNRDPATPVKELSIAQQQMVEIIRAISFGAKIIVMDEPTSSLTDSEVDALFASIEQLKKKGVGIIYISHRMAELDIIADRITIMRDGEYIATVDAKKTTHEEWVAAMVGRELGNLYDKHNHSTQEIILKVEHLASGKEVRDVSFELKKGEILGFSGLVGSGRSEAMSCIFGLRKKDRGEIYVEGKAVDIHCVKDAMEAGIGFVPEDRKQSGIFPIQGIRFNTTIEVLDRFLKGGRYQKKKELELAREFVDGVMQTKYAGMEQEIQNLSGGNQQKIIISRWLLVTKKILILDEPTRGIDVKTKSDIYHLMDALTEKGFSILFISSEMPELINMCDRIVVMNQGHTAGVLKRDEFDQETILSYATKEL